MWETLLAILNLRNLNYAVCYVGLNKIGRIYISFGTYQEIILLTVM